MGEMDGALLFQAVDMCYFSGTAQDGLVYIPKDGEPVVMMKRSLERAREESPLEVRPLQEHEKSEIRPWHPGWRHHRPGDGCPSLQLLLSSRQGPGRCPVCRCGRKDQAHPLCQVRVRTWPGQEAARILEAGFSSVPDYIQEGMTEVDLMCRLESEMRSLGHQGCTALSQIQQHCSTGPCHVRSRRLPSPASWLRLPVERELLSSFPREQALER